MLVRMIVETPVIGKSIDSARQTYVVQNGLDADVATLRLECRWVSDNLSLWGISSSWTVVDVGDGRWLIEFSGPRHSLHDWLPDGWLDEAHRQWLNFELLEYYSTRDDVSPREVGLTALPPYRQWVWDDPEWVSSVDDYFPPVTRWGQVHKEGAFGKGY